MAATFPSGIMHTYRQVFLRGLATILPTLLTAWFLYACWGFISNTVAGPIANGLKTQLVTTSYGNDVLFYVWEDLAFLRKATISEPPSYAKWGSRPTRFTAITYAWFSMARAMTS